MPKLIVGRKLVSFDGGTAEVEVPEYIEEIADRAFFDCGYIISVTLPDGLCEIGDHAFKMCYSMKNISMPHSIRRMGKGVFQQCWSLERLILPDGTHSIDRDMLAGCSALKELTIPDSVGEIDRQAFAGCGLMDRLRISPQHLEVLPPVSVPAAVMTYMTDHHGSADGDSAIDAYAVEHSKLLTELAIDHDEKDAVDYMLSHGLINGPELRDHIRMATELGRTEIAAMLLQGGQAGRAGGDEFEWDPFA